MEDATEGLLSDCVFDVAATVVVRAEVVSKDDTVLVAVYDDGEEELTARPLASCVPAKYPLFGDDAEVAGVPYGELFEAPL